MERESLPWVKEFSGAITVCDAQGIILSMNDQAAAAYQGQGGRRLVGTNLLDCHPEPARAKLVRMMENPQPNVYTIEKKGRHRLIYHTPWYQNGHYSGFMELALEIPDPMPHFVREG
jgi:transcriptional regulator with PAS, ATPase and Fis domain